MIDRESRVPPHRQLARIIAERIESGEISNRLPSIVDIVQTYAVARSTAQKALRVLEAEGVAEKVTGMGYYVAEKDLRRRFASTSAPGT
jgi:DNA-binding GntR family transcriptional regulator